ncbi:hypothetical protein [Plebeiibacterium marinum]|uniref:Secretion system C-terminal sorting domain-containing protein n=1 Tax=Plebeiibacterium marinum TaxID=2992111 RepID=A0AAE3MGF8_9BACT|nr:hypothetical protein [Plebeiobacterium marinum]MCW3807119.1 hypothetical protein [Plebeiobacterium marinum]
MKKTLQLFILIVLCLYSTGIYSQSTGIIYIYNDSESLINVYAGTNINADLEVVDRIKSYGYEVTAISLPVISDWTTEQQAQLENAALVIIGRGISSSNFTGANADLWNNLEVPVICTNLWALRSDKMGWFNTTTASHDNTQEAVLEATILETSDVVFEGINTPVAWWSGQYDILPDVAADICSGTVMATTSYGFPLFVRFPANQACHNGSSPATPKGERVFFGIGNDNIRIDGMTVFNYYGYTDEAHNIFMREIGRLSGITTSTNYVNKDKTDLKVFYNSREITVSMKGLTKINIFSIVGQLQESITVKSDQEIISLSQYNSGVFVIVAYDKDGKKATEKVMIQ